MHISASRLTCAVVAAALVGAAPAVRTAAPPKLELTVDSVMRGPKLVGYPQTGLRWLGLAPRTSPSTRVSTRRLRPSSATAVAAM